VCDVMAKYVVTPNPPWVKILRDPYKRALYSNLKKIQLKPVKRLLFQFDPWHQQTRSIRDFLTHITGPKLRDTNPRCGVKTEILSNREEPQVIVSFENGKSIIFKTALLTELEIVEHLNRYIEKNSDDKTPSSF